MKNFILTILSCIALIIVYMFGYCNGRRSTEDACNKWKDACKSIEETYESSSRIKDDRIEILKSIIESYENELAVEFERAKRFVLSDLERQFLPAIENSLITPIVEICSEHDSCVVSVIKKENGPYEISHTTFK